MLIKAGSSALMLVDMQEKLMPLVVDSSIIEKNAHWLLSIAHYLSIPLVASEQYPEKLGNTISALSEFILPDHCKSKIAFSAMNEPAISKEVRTIARDQWILIGIETHVCVLQTALGLLEHGKEVFVVADCTSSRRAEDKSLALDRLRHAGVNIVSREMVVFEWLSVAGTPQFKHINEAFIK